MLSERFRCGHWTSESRERGNCESARTRRPRRQLQGRHHRSAPSENQIRQNCAQHSRCYRRRTTVQGIGSAVLTISSTAVVSIMVVAHYNSDD